MNEPILVDSSIWIASFRGSVPLLAEIATTGRLRMHPYVHAELALGTVPRPRAVTLRALAEIRSGRVASHKSVLQMIEDRGLNGCRIGYVDAHLVAACLITPGLKLWTTDKPLTEVAQRLGIAAQLTN